ncbi:TRAP transporter large permease [Rhodoplanes sp. TEM]|uniref:TRAP transporter large permease protein n=1 Tax=Rhodoplanes tepidamans TaxID=200616 RepID=A0ABT5J946_RHOTP|nr:MULTISPECIES: TRAP transporter large permease [Rhodoplanes]MDC7786175.1 TRAP transporter large permease [Rhodoplanes tepidamans]MDC7982842.1 TRAP transporter large permease [Rhodoplanes sp. TEM]MDQ0357160.1 C4-dicarboxylate transporter DctM subunit [Rhodoplanes tepidamans]
MTVILLCVIAVILLVLGFEMFLVMGIPTLLAWHFLFSSIPPVALAQKLLGGVNVSTLLAIPFFIFAADIMARGTIAKRLTDLVKTNIGHVRGGIGHTTVVSCMGFGAICGSAPATVAALGRLLHPELLKARYSETFSLALIASSAECALLIPPSITLIIYGWLTGTSIADLFAGGFAVGVALGVAFMIYVQIVTWRTGAGLFPRATRGERMLALRDGLVALGMPFIILGGIYGGIFTATEAAAVAVAYALLIEMVVYRSIGFKVLLEIAEGSAITVAVIFILLATGSMLSFLITLAQVPAFFTQLFAAWNVDWIVFLLIVNVVLLVAGMFIDPNSILLVLIPTFYPVATSLGIDPVHFGLVVCLNICIGMITPPFGLDLFVASSTLRRPVELIIRGIWPFIAVNVLVLLLITYVPQISTGILSIMR